MCDYKPTPLGQESDHGDGVKIYRHLFAGLVIRTHRTVRTSPAGWVWSVELSGKQVTFGYAPTQRQALGEAAHRMSGQCGYAPRHYAEGFSGKAYEPTDYTGRHSNGNLARWAA